MNTPKKLKDLKKGDRLWLQDFTGTTPILVESAKRQGNIVTVSIKWDKSEYEAYGPALGFKCVARSKLHHEDLVFTTNLDDAEFETEKRQKYRQDACIADAMRTLKNVLFG